MIAERLSARRALGQCKNVTLFYACAQGRDASPSKHPMAHSKKVYDAHLSTLCWRSRVAFRQWKAADSPDLAHFMMKERPARNMSDLSHCQARFSSPGLAKFSMLL